MAVSSSEARNSGTSIPVSGTSPVAPGNGLPSSTSNSGQSDQQLPVGMTPTLEAVAIVGYSCRLSGHVTSPEDLWELCSRARSGWCEIPANRFSKDAFHHPNPSKKGCFNPKGGYFLQQDIAAFDAPFFNMTAQEAIAMDPQQRILMECTFEALENAGIPKESVIGKNVGVFAGGSFADYELNNCRDTDTSPMYQATGCAAAMLSNRLSYYFDLRGPSATFDTACSSSLVALHIGSPKIHSNLHAVLTVTRLFNDDGKTYAFDHRAKSGFARGEGAGVVVLKSLEAAIRDRDVIRAVIQNSGVNQDGRTQGITTPNGDAQRDLIKYVYANAKLDPAECGFAEMHGTGTKVGDPIEAAGVREALGMGRTARAPLYIGSVKSNIGHLEGASGLISVIKAAMMLDKRLILPNANFEKANEAIPLAEWNMKVATSTRPWPRGKKYISVSNYGFGGTNAHVVLGAAPPSTKPFIGSTEASAADPPDPQRKLFVLSANDQESLKHRVKDLGVYLEQRPEVFEKLLGGNIAYTLGQRRSHLACRLAIPALSSDELGVRLATAKVSSNRVRNEPTLGFVFTGQGAQWATMGAALMKDYPIFAEAIDAADKCLRSIGATFSMKEELLKPADESLINQAHISQPACSAIQIGLTNLFASWGISPLAVVGHSSGEICCAYAAGIIGLEDAMKIAYYRGQCTLTLKKDFAHLQGTMLAVGAGQEEIQPYCDAVNSGYTTIACINSPCSVTVSGDVDAVAELQKILTEKDIFNRQLKVGVAYHSAHLNPVAKDYYDLIKDIQPNTSAKATFYSSLLGRIAQPSELDATYWVQNLTSPVKFSPAVAALAGDAIVNTLIELGPHSALQGPIKDILATVGDAKTKIQYAPSLLRNTNASECALNLASTLFVKGASLNFSEINFPVSKSATQTVVTDLPIYQWQHGTKYWHESRISDKHRYKTGVRNDVLGTLADYSNDLEPTWRNILRLDDLPWLRHHKMQAMPVFPMTGYMVMALEAASQRAATRGVQFDHFDLREFVTSAALVLNEENDVEITITLRPYSEGLRGYSDLWDEFRICSWDTKRGWIEHCRGLVAVRGSGSNAVDVKRSQIAADTLKARTDGIEAEAKEEVNVPLLYEQLTEVGAGYGSTFQGLSPCFGSDTGAWAKLIAPNTKAVLPKEHESNLIVHPAFLDQFLQVVWPTFGAGRQGFETLYMPTFVKRVRISKNLTCDGLTAYSSGRPNAKDPQATKFDIFAIPEGGSETVINFEGLVMTPLRETDVSSGPETRDLCYKVAWQPAVEPEVVEVAKSEAPSDAPAEVPATGEVQVNGGEPASAEAADVSGDSAYASGDATPSAAAYLSGQDVVIVHMGADDAKYPDSLASAISNVSDRRPEISGLSEADVAGKVVVFLAPEKNLLLEPTEQLFGVLRQVLLDASSVLWVYKAGLNEKDVENSMAIGFTRSIRSETSAKIATLGLHTSGTEDAAETKAILHVLRLAWSDEPSSFKDDREFEEKNGQIMVPRVFDDEKMNTFIHRESQETSVYQQPFEQAGRRMKMVIASPGALDTFYWVDEEVPALGDKQVEVEVKATGMNFKDVVVSMGQLAQPYIGVECAGVINAVGKDVTDVKVGDRVMAMSEGAYSTYARCLSTSVSVIPDEMSFVSACTVPVVFCTAYYGLFDLGRLVEGEKVLIHAGAGGVGQAAIQLATMAKAEIFTTVGSNDKKQFIMDTYGIPADHIFYSRDTTFGGAVRRATNGEGVDVVLNSLAGDVLRETWDCLAPFGRFIEIGKADITRNSRLEMAQFEYNLTFASVDLTKVAGQRPKLMQRLLSDVVKLMDAKTVNPIAPITTYGIDQVEAAFRSLQSGKSMGKLVINPQPGQQVKAVTSKHSNKILKADASYIIIGGTGGLGRSMAKWMASRGAKFIILVSRSATLSPKVLHLIDELAHQGVTVQVHPCDVSHREHVDSLIKTVESEAPPVRGVVQGAMVLKVSFALSAVESNLY
nr:reducing polyketide synthase pks1 [Quercus suber]